MRITMLGFLPLAAGSPLALASSLAEGSGAVVAAAGCAAVPAALGASLEVELDLLSPLDLAICDEKAIMPPIIANAILAAIVLFSLSMVFSLGLGTGLEKVFRKGD